MQIFAKIKGMLTVKSNNFSFRDLNKIKNICRNFVHHCFCVRLDFHENSALVGFITSKSNCLYNLLHQKLKKEMVTSEMYAVSQRNSEICRYLFEVV